MIVSPYSSKISVFLPPQAVQTNTQSTANTRRANFFMIGFCGGNFFWKKSLPRTPFQKTFILYIRGLGFVFFGFCEGNFFGKKSPSRSLPKTFILYSKGLIVQTGHRKIQPFPSFPQNYIPQSLPVEGGSQREPLANDLLMPWTEPDWCAIGLAQTPPISNPHIKVLRSFFKSDRSPRSPRSPRSRN